jgi:ABC-type dipeptide/oligopeptide/nickel transport system permease component
MAAYVFRRLLHGIPIILGVTLVTFVLFHIFGGNPVAQFLGKHASVQDLRALEKEYGFDQPLYLQYLDYLWQIVRLIRERSRSASYVIRLTYAENLFDAPRRSHPPPGW